MSGASYTEGIDTRAVTISSLASLGSIADSVEQIKFRKTLNTNASVGRVVDSAVQHSPAHLSGSKYRSETTLKAQTFLRKF